MHNEDIDGPFLNYSILSNQVRTTMMQHYFATHGGEKAAPIPPHVSEGITLVLQSLSRLVNGDITAEQSWIDLERVSSMVLATNARLKQAAEHQEDKSSNVDATDNGTD